MADSSTLPPAPRPNAGERVPSGTGSESFLRFIYTTPGEMNRHSDAVDALYEGTLQGIVVRGLYPPEAMREVVEKLEGGRHRFKPNFFPYVFRASLYGLPVDLSPPDLEEYFRQAAAFREENLRLFSGLGDYESNVEKAFSALARGRKSQPPPGPKEGQVYTSATIRILPPGGKISLHVGNEANTRAPYNHLKTIVNFKVQLSFFLTLQRPEKGGELIVYSLRWGDPAIKINREGRSHMEHEIHKYERQPFQFDAGDLLIFDGGRYFHEVTTVEGSKTRYTIGGFTGISRDDQSIYYWS